LCRAYFNNHSRLSASVFPWAEKLVYKITFKALDECCDDVTNANFNLCIIKVELFGRRADICYEVTVQQQGYEVPINTSSDLALQKRPIHFIRQKRNVFHIFRHSKMDALVADNLAITREFERDPLPLFKDWDHIHKTVNGRRVENPNADIIIKPVYKDGIRKAENLIYDPGPASNIPRQFRMFYYHQELVWAMDEADEEDEADEVARLIEEQIRAIANQGGTGEVSTLVADTDERKAGEHQRMLEEPARADEDYNATAEDQD